MSLGIYDSGLGGLVILKEIAKTFPDTSIKYLADTKMLPLGSKTGDEIRERVKKVVDYFFENDCSLVILACNTASISSIRTIQQEYIKKKYPNKNVLGINIPLLESLNEHYSDLKEEKGILLSTPTTHNSGFYQQELVKLGFNNVTSLACRDLTLAIESGSSERIQEAVDNCLAAVKNKSENIKFVILACTHYPLAIKQIKKRLPSASIFHQKTDVALKLKDYLLRHPEYQLSKGDRLFLTTKKIKDFDSKASKIIGESISFKFIRLD